jgi:hypothetical protein
MHFPPHFIPHNSRGKVRVTAILTAKRVEMTRLTQFLDTFFPGIHIKEIADSEQASHSMVFPHDSLMGWIEGDESKTGIEVVGIVTLGKEDEWGARADMHFTMDDQGVSLFDVCTIRMRRNRVALIAAKLRTKLLPDCHHWESFAW